MSIGPTWVIIDSLTDVVQGAAQRRRDTCGSAAADVRIDPIAEADPGVWLSGARCSHRPQRIAIQERGRDRQGGHGQPLLEAGCRNMHRVRG